MPNDEARRYFYEIYEALPRQGPGDRDSTRRALGLLPPFPRGQRLLDVGCGAGAQTIDLAQATDAQITALDHHPAFVARTRQRVAELGLEGRVTVQSGDMKYLRFADASFDVIWCEGAIFVIGFAEGLSAWRRLLVPGGHLVVSELCWVKDDPPEDLVAYFRSEGVDIRSLEARRQAIGAAGYRPVADFVLPAVGWWENYYRPLDEELRRFEARHAGDSAALGVAAGCRKEIDCYLRYPGYFSYGFFVMQRP